MTQQRLDESDILDKWRTLAPLIERMMERVGTEGEFPVAQGSSLAGDDKASDPYHVSHVVRMCLTAAIDHLHAVKVLVVDNGVLHVSAPSSLARGALENLAAAYWVLGPTTRDERIERALRWYAKNNFDADRATAGRSIPNLVSLDDKMQKLYAVGARRSISQKTIKAQFSSTEAVKYAEANAENLPLGVLLPWQLCSGFAHGRPWAYLGASDLAKVPIPNTNVQRVKMTGSMGMALYPNLAAIQLLERFLRLHDRRSNSHLV